MQVIFQNIVLTGSKEHVGVIIKCNDIKEEFRTRRLSLEDGFMDSSGRKIHIDIIITCCSAGETNNGEVLRCRWLWRKTWHEMNFLWILQQLFSISGTAPFFSHNSISSLFCKMPINCHRERLLGESLCLLRQNKFAYVTLLVVYLYWHTWMTCQALNSRGIMIWSRISTSFSVSFQLVALTMGFLWCSLPRACGKTTTTRQSLTGSLYTRGNHQKTI